MQEGQIMCPANRRGNVRAFSPFTGGQVRFVSENIHRDTWRAPATRANNEIIDDEDY